MFFTKSFGRGGCSPVDNKFLTDNCKIENADVPNIAYIPVVQHAGVPAEIIVKTSERVEEGQLIARAKDGNSCNVHASIPGKVAGFEEKYLYNGKKAQVILIALDGEFRKSGKIHEQSDWAYKPKEYLINTIKEYGLVELTNHAVPLYKKYSIPKDKKVETLIINGTETEPFLTGDYRLMIDKTGEVLDGIKIIREKILNAEKCYLAIGSDKRDAVRKFKSLTEDNHNIRIVTLKKKYPQGNETLLIRAITGKILPVNMEPPDIGMVVTGIGTAYAVKEALVNDKPLIERVVTITGSGIAGPKNLKVKFGTLVSEVVKECGGLKPGVKKIVIGGPMTGYSIVNMDIPITKECGAIIALTEEEYNEYRENAVCINCGKCIDSCGFGLMPVKINRYIKFNRYQDALDAGLLNCRECGCCAYQCPARIPLVQNFKMAKETVKIIKNGLNY